MTRAFGFKLARVLAVRAIEERSAEMAWAVCERIALGAEERLAAARVDVAAARGALARLQTAPRLDLGALARGDRSLRQLLALVRRSLESARTARAAADEARRAWYERRRDREALERLRERLRAEHARELEKSELAALEETAAAGRERNSRLAPAARARGSSPASAATDPAQ